MTCSNCATASQVEHWDFTAGCQQCAARSLARIFIAKEERGSRFKRACVQHGVTPEDVRKAWAADAMNGTQQHGTHFGTQNAFAYRAPQPQGARIEICSGDRRLWLPRP